MKAQFKVGTYPPPPLFTLHIPPKKGFCKPLTGPQISTRHTDTDPGISAGDIIHSYGLKQNTEGKMKAPHSPTAKAWLLSTAEQPPTSPP